MSIAIGNREDILPPAERKAEMSAVDLALYSTRFTGCRDRQFEFARGTLLAKLHSVGKFDEAQLRAAHRVLADFERASGASGGVTMMWRDKIDGSLAGSRSPRRAWTNTAHDRLMLLVDGELTARERQLFIDVFVHDYFKRWSGDRLPEMGFLLTGYAGKDQATSAGVSRIQALLDRVARFYSEH
ncbi:hypothetical protein JDN40_10610 [Rhodomicrobium vannielii ATCC 17100]|uniref:hypothetical protein n=1 Tax=Rhodomicrobium vannielii TaxID=1069 RepID=UPI001917FB57|nr:hypothetical protein [Rhodomicrobium vannielii]MBJ7534555.1 hypothetical protein [Rhodomicrobium vannielii ATCC 17100]